MSNMGAQGRVQATKYSISHTTCFTCPFYSIAVLFLGTTSANLTDPDMSTASCKDISALSQSCERMAVWPTRR